MGLVVAADVGMVSGWWCPLAVSAWGSLRPGDRHLPGSGYLLPPPDSCRVSPPVDAIQARHPAARRQGVTSTLGLSLGLDRIRFCVGQLPASFSPAMNPSSPARAFRPFPIPSSISIELACSSRPPSLFRSYRRGSAAPSKPA